MSKELSLITNKELESAVQIDMAVSELLNSGLKGFALLKAKTKVVSIIKKSFTQDESFMKDVMSLQGEQFGFRTDCKKGESYPQEVVTSCLVTATLRGVEPTDNQFNILGGNCYITKNGVTHILKKINVQSELTYSLSKEINGQTTIMVTIEWIHNGKPGKKVIEFPVKVYKGVTTEDAIRGKAERKAKAWLIEHITGMDIGDGEVENNTVDGGYANVVTETTTTTTETPIEKKSTITKSQQDRFDKHIQTATTLDDLEKKSGDVCKGFKVNLSDFGQEMYEFMKKKFSTTT